jgi:hypothetical protein
MCNYLKFSNLVASMTTSVIEVGDQKSTPDSILVIVIFALESKVKSK